MFQVGYGDMYPETWMGKVVASILVFVSMVYLALPMTIIVSKFNKAFEKFKPEEQKRKEKEERIKAANQNCGVPMSRKHSKLSLPNSTDAPS